MNQYETVKFGGGLECPAAKGRILPSEYCQDQQDMAEIPPLCPRTASHNRFGMKIPVSW